MHSPNINDPQKPTPTNYTFRFPPASGIHRGDGQRSLTGKTIALIKAALIKPFTLIKSLVRFNPDDPFWR